MSNEKQWHPSMIAGSQGFTSNPDGSFTLWDTDGKQHRYVPESALTEVEAERDRLAAELAELRAQEPVAWIRGDRAMTNDTLSDHDIADHSELLRHGWKPLYAAPVPAAVAESSVADICNAYESGVGHRGRPTAHVNPYPEGSDLFVAYALGALGEEHLTPLAVPAAVPDDVARDAAVGAAIERAAGSLPRGYSIEIEIENGAATVRLYDDEFCRLGYDGDGDTLAGEINTATDTALAAAQKEEGE